MLYMQKFNTKSNYRTCQKVAPLVEHYPIITSLGLFLT